MTTWTGICFPTNVCTQTYTYTCTDLCPPYYQSALKNKWEAWQTAVGSCSLPLIPEPPPSSCYTGLGREEHAPAYSIFPIYFKPDSYREKRWQWSGRQKGKRGFQISMHFLATMTTTDSKGMQTNFCGSTNKMEGRIWFPAATAAAKYRSGLTMTVICLKFWRANATLH